MSTLEYKVGDEVIGVFGRGVVFRVLENGLEVKAPSSTGHGTSLFVVLKRNVKPLAWALVEKG